MLLQALLFSATAALSQTIKLDFQVAELENDPLRHRDVLRARDLELPVYNDFPYQRYLINITAGTPPQRFAVMLDSGSTDLWLPSNSSPACAPKCPPGSYDPWTSSTAVDINIKFNASYGLTPDNIMLGEYFNDTIGIGDITLTNQTFARAEVIPTNYEAGHWGIIGMGSKLRTSAYENPASPIAHDLDKAPLPVWLHLYEAGLIEKKLYSVWLNSQDAKTGSVLLGGIDDSKYDGELKATPVHLQGPKKLFENWEVTMTSVSRVNGQTGTTENLTASSWSLDHATVDTGSPNMYLPSSLYNAIVAPLNATMHPTANTPYVPCSFRSSEDYLEWGFAGRDGQAGPMIRMPYREAIYRFGTPASLGEMRDKDGNELCYFGIIPMDGNVVLVGDVLTRNAYVVFDAEAYELRMAQVKTTPPSYSQAGEM